MLVILVLLCSLAARIVSQVDGVGAANLDSGHDGSKANPMFAEWAIVLKLGKPISLLDFAPSSCSDSGLLREVSVEVDKELGTPCLF